METVIEKIPSLYKCNPEWPICLFDFSFRNQNPQSVSLRVKPKLTAFIQQDYFNTQMLCDLKIAELERERE